MQWKTGLDLIRALDSNEADLVSGTDKSLMFEILSVFNAFHWPSVATRPASPRSQAE